MKTLREWLRVLSMSRYLQPPAPPDKADPSFRKTDTPQAVLLERAADHDRDVRYHEEQAQRALQSAATGKAKAEAHRAAAHQCRMAAAALTDPGQHNQAM